MNLAFYPPIPRWWVAGTPVPSPSWGVGRPKGKVQADAANGHPDCATPRLSSKDDSARLCVRMFKPDPGLVYVAGGYGHMRSPDCRDEATPPPSSHSFLHLRNTAMYPVKTEGKRCLLLCWWALSRGRPRAPGAALPKTRGPTGALVSQCVSARTLGISKVYCGSRFVNMQCSVLQVMAATSPLTAACSRWA